METKQPIQEDTCPIKRRLNQPRERPHRLREPGSRYIQESKSFIVGVNLFKEIARTRGKFLAATMELIERCSLQELH